MMNKYFELLHSGTVKLSP